MKDKDNITPDALEEAEELELSKSVSDCYDDDDDDWDDDDDDDDD